MTHQTLDQFIQAFRTDDNCWWLLSPGEMGDYFDAALERIDEAKAENKRLRAALAGNRVILSAIEETHAENERLRAALAGNRVILRALAEAERLFDIVPTSPDAPAFRQTYTAWQSQYAIAPDMLRAWHKRDQTSAAGA